MYLFICCLTQFSQRFDRSCLPASRCRLLRFVCSLSRFMLSTVRWRLSFAPAWPRGASTTPRRRRQAPRRTPLARPRLETALVCLFGSLSLVLSLFMLYVPLSHCFASFPQGLHRKRSRMLQAIACKISTEIGSFFFRLLTIFVTETHSLSQSNV